MVSFSAAAVLLLPLVAAGSASAAEQALHASGSRRLSFDLIAGYEPRSLVTDHVSRVRHLLELSKHCFPNIKSHLSYFL
jgi:hypothetical protein